MKRLLLIDADILIYAVASAQEVPMEWEEDVWTLHSDFAAARLEFSNRVERLRTTLNADDVVMALTTKETNFRTLLLPTYKMNRKKVRKPLCWNALREYCTQSFVTFVRDGLEGDDCLGILATRTSDKDVEKIVVSIDKDFKTIPGKHYNQHKPEEGIRTVSEDDADYFHMMQTLTGDATDGYTGCRGVGPKAAERLLDAATLSLSAPPDTWRVLWWLAVVDTYKKMGFGEEYALVQARCARILRACDYNFTHKTPILWRPPTA